MQIGKKLLTSAFINWSYQNEFEVCYESVFIKIIQIKMICLLIDLSIYERELKKITMRLTKLFKGIIFRSNTILYLQRHFQKNLQTKN